MKRKVVLQPITVPAGDYCWEFKVMGSCQYFNNEGGHSKCELGFYPLKDSGVGVIKANECFHLKESS
jgi:hypothetical protein